LTAYGDPVITEEDEGEKVLSIFEPEGRTRRTVLDNHSFKTGGFTRTNVYAHATQAQKT
jgi:hypothetical protein